MIKFTTDMNVCILFLHTRTILEIVERIDIWEKKNT